MGRQEHSAWEQVAWVLVPPYPPCLLLYVSPWTSPVTCLGLSVIGKMWMSIPVPAT